MHTDGCLTLETGGKGKEKAERMIFPQFVWKDHFEKLVQSPTWPVFTLKLRSFSTLCSTFLSPGVALISNSTF